MPAVVETDEGGPHELRQGNDDHHGHDLPAGAWLVVTLLVGLMLVPEVDATKHNDPRLGSISSQVRNQREMCEFPAGTFSSK